MVVAEFKQSFNPYFKNLYTEISPQYTSDAKNKALRPWAHDIVNHFWYCSRKASGNLDAFIVSISCIWSTFFLCLHFLEILFWDKLDCFLVTILIFCLHDFTYQYLCIDDQHIGLIICNSN